MSRFSALYVAVLAISLAAFACTPSNVIPPPDASDAAAPATLCGSACAVLRVVGCPEGNPADCAATLQHIQDDRLVRTASGMPLTCAAVSSVTTAAQARAAGVACSPPGEPPLPALKPGDVVGHRSGDAGP